MAYHTTKTLHARASAWSRHRPQAEVLHGTISGAFVAITVNVRGTSWFCHPHPEGDEWDQRKSHRVFTRGQWRAMAPKVRFDRPPRWVRKAAKMALRRWLQP